MAAGTALGKIDVTSNLKALEREAVESFKALEKAEKGFGPGLRFGRVMIDLRNSIKHGDWMPTLERLHITYRKAQYWMDMVKWQNGERPSSPKKSSVNKKTGKFDWDVATDWLEDLGNKVKTQLKKRDPDGVDRFAKALIQLANELRGRK